MQTTTEEPKQQTETKSTPPSENLLRELGFTVAADSVKTDRELARKLRTAFNFYQVVRPEHIVTFNAKLKKETYVEEGYVEQFNYLHFTPIQSYAKVPPQEALEKLLEAKGRNCFDQFEVATIEKMRVDNTPVPDPIIFGRITGSDLRFPVAQWDQDVSVEDLIGTEEGWPTA